MFYKILTHAHSGLRYVVILMLLATIITAFSHWRSKSETWPDKIKRLFKVNLTIIHLQVLLGIILYFLSPKVQFNEATMKDSIIRFFTVEHALMMLILVLVLTIAWAKTKRMVDVIKRYKTQFIYNLIALLVILAMIPWPFRNLGGLWF